MPASNTTPGPWHVGGNGTIVYAADGLAVANATTYHGRTEPETGRANAALIAAAPCMLALVRATARGVCSCTYYGDDAHGEPSYSGCLVCDAREIIKTLEEA